MAHVWPDWTVQKKYIQNNNNDANEWSEEFYIHEHCLTKTQDGSVVASSIMGLCNSLTLNMADLDEWGWQCSHASGVIFLSLFPFFIFSTLCFLFPELHITVEFLPGPTLVDKNQWVMMVEVDMTKRSQLDYIASEINYFLVMSIPKMISQTEAPRGDTVCARHFIWRTQMERNPLVCAWTC